MSPLLAMPLLRSFPKPPFFRDHSQRLTVSRALAAARPIASALTLRHVALEQAALGDRHVPRRMITLRDIFAPRRLEQDEFNGNCVVVTGGGEKLSSFGDEKRAQLHRLDRLQEVANLALEDRAGKGEAWGCADIGTGELAEKGSRLLLGSP